MTIKKPCTECKFFIKSTKECSNAKAEYYMIHGITSVKIGCENQEKGESVVEKKELGDFIIE